MGKYLNLACRLGLLVLFLAAGGFFSPAQGEQPTTIWAGEPSKHAVALTFDDGPSPRYTPEILALLKQYGAHATFFVLGCKVEKYPRLIKAMLQDGHEVGNHTFSHPRLPKTEQLARERELERTRLDLDLLGCPQKHKLIRPPYSAYDDRLVSYLSHTHRELVLWSIDSGDWRGLEAGKIVKNVLARVRNGSIIVFHDSDEKDQADRKPTVEALKVILPALRKAGYRLVTVSELVEPQSPH
jgi:peptidoglycan/xylan/chitin deacetylase (PgdA/CDA1 family)